MILQLLIATFRTMPPNEFDEKKKCSKINLLWSPSLLASSILLLKNYDSTHYLQHASTDDCAAEEILFRLWDRLYDKIFAEFLRYMILLNPFFAEPSLQRRQHFPRFLL